MDSILLLLFPINLDENSKNEHLIKNHPLAIMFTDYTGSMSFKNGKLSGLIKPVEVQLYRLKG